MTKLKEMRVAFFCDAILQRNGVGTYYNDLFEHLREHIEQIDLIGPQLQGGSPFQGWSFPLPGDPTQRVFLPKFKQLVNYFRRHSPQVVIVPIPAFYGLAGLSIARQLHVPVIAGYHTHYGELIEMTLNGYSRRPLRLLAQNWHRIFFQAASTVVVNSDNMADSARSLGVTRVEIVGTPLGRPFLEDIPNRTDSTCNRIIFAGRLAPEKNIQDLIAAATVLPDCRFMIVGDGPLRGYVQESARRLPNLDTVGWCERHALIQLIDRSDLLVLPSRVEGFGTIALEAMARKTNVLISKECGLLDWPSLARYAFVKENGELLADAIGRVLGVDQCSRRDLVACASAAVRQFNRETISQWLHIIQDAIHSRIKPQPYGS